MTEWTRTDPRWAQLNPYQRAAAMALLEADGANPVHARNALAAMINRSRVEGVDLGEHVSRRIYQPTIEPAQQARLARIIQSPAYGELTGWAQRRAAGQEPDIVNGATHFLAHPRVMLQLSGGVRPDGRGGYVGNSSKYHSWPRWTGFDPSTNQYRGQVHADGSHAFLIPASHRREGDAAPPAQPQQPAMSYGDWEPRQTQNTMAPLGPDLKPQAPVAPSMGAPMTDNAFVGPIAEQKPQQQPPRYQLPIGGMDLGIDNYFMPRRRRLA